MARLGKKVLTSRRASSSSSISLLPSDPFEDGWISYCLTYKAFISHLVYSSNLLIAGPALSVASGNSLMCMWGGGLPPGPVGEGRLLLISSSSVVPLEPSRAIFALFSSLLGHCFASQTPFPFLALLWATLYPLDRWLWPT